MLITMGITLLSSRILLSTLCVEDYGVYNIIGGIVVLISVVSNSMMSATQRFITYEIGKGSVDSKHLYNYLIFSIFKELL